MVNNNKRAEIQEIASKVILEEKDSLLFISIRLGKTRIALKAIEENDSVLVIYPNVDIKKSWEDELLLFQPLSNDITFTTAASLKKYKDKYYDFVIIDEPQKCQSLKQIQYLKTIKFKKRVALTGTLSRKTINKLDEQLGLKIKFTYGLEDAIKDKIVKNYKINIHCVDLDNKIYNTKYKRYGKEVLGTELQAYNSYSSMMSYFENKYLESSDLKYNLGFKKYMGIRSNYIYNSLTLFNLAQNIINQYKDNKVLIYTLRQDIADRLSGLSYHSKNKQNSTALIDFKLSEKGHLSVVNCIQSGITIKNLNCVVFHSYEKNSETLYQKLGRSLLYEYEGEISKIHICVLKNTQMESWVNSALKSLDQSKITYNYKGNIYSKLEWIKFNNPGKQLFEYNGSICYLIDKFQQQFSKYVFIEDGGYKEYSLSKDKLIKL